MKEWFHQTLARKGRVMAIVAPSIGDSRLRPSPPLYGKELISANLWKRLANRIMIDADVDLALAERILEQALGFLHLLAITNSSNYSPAPMVDVGWHTFILNTKDYANFCERVAGRFIHHKPADDPEKEYKPDRINKTIEELENRGFRVDPDLWLGRAKC
jgi:hypothetical protein